MKTTALLLLALASTSAAASGQGDAAAAAGAATKPAAAANRRRRTAARAVRPGARRMHKVPGDAEEVETKLEDNAEGLPEEAPLAGKKDFLTPNEEADASVFISQEIEAKEEEGLADAASSVVAGIINDQEYDNEDEDLLEGSMSVDWASMSMTDGSLSMDDGSMSADGSVQRRRRRMTEAAANRHRRRVQSKRAREMTA